MSLPEFTRQGTLPPGIHEADWAEIETRFGAAPFRQRLIAGLRAALLSLKEAGCVEAYIDGSFVTNKPRPGDFDACWSVAGVDADLLDPVLLIFDHGRAAQKAKFAGELFPAELPEGISGRTFLEFFQIDRATGGPKGIVLFRLDRWEP
ncbi:MAG TPA: hypothetical protein VFJ58_00285 [Armatimonadota bacterium]|nr:hypothetical protein [Armatimonadota bacterium]